MSSLEEYLTSLGFKDNNLDQEKETVDSVESEVLIKLDTKTDIVFVKNRESDKTSNTVEPDYYVPKSERKRFNNKRVPQSGYLYVVVDEINQVCKIGISENPQKRLKGLQTGYHIPLKPLFSVYLEDARGMEQVVHEALDDFRLNGEWFYLNAYYLVDWNSLKDFRIA